MNKQLIYNIPKHILFWVVYLFLPIIIFPRADVNYIDISQFVIFNYFFSSLYSIAFFYVNFYWAIPSLAYKKKVLKYVLVLLLSVFICYTVFKIIPTLNNLETEGIISFQFIVALLKLTFVNIISWIIFLQKINQDHSIAKNEAELAYLRSQINPHFLFNVLNSLYALAINKSENLVDTISQVSDMMRYNIEESQKRFVSLNQELEYLQCFINIQKLRLTNKTVINYWVKGEIGEKRIEPLLLIAFIENAFKYGVSTEKESEIIIKIEVIENKLKLFIKNHKVRKFSNTSGTGIMNTIKRLDYTYSNRYDLDISDREDCYIVLLTIEVS